MNELSEEVEWIKNDSEEWQTKLRLVSDKWKETS